MVSEVSVVKTGAVGYFPLPILTASEERGASASAKATADKSAKASATVDK